LNAHRVIPIRRVLNIVLTIAKSKIVPILSKNGLENN
jgi:hypothetical protein